MMLPGFPTMLSGGSSGPPIITSLTLVGAGENYIPSGSYPMPNTLPGDIIFVGSISSGIIPSVNSGYTHIGLGSSGAVFVHGGYKIADGTEGGTNPDFGSSQNRALYVVLRPSFTHPESSITLTNTHAHMEAGGTTITDTINTGSSTSTSLIWFSVAAKDDAFSIPTNNNLTQGAALIDENIEGIFSHNVLSNYQNAVKSDIGVSLASSAGDYPSFVNFALEYN